MTARVYKSTGSWYHLKTETGQFIKARLKGKFRIKGLKSTNPVAVGDLVDYEFDESSDEQTAVITKINERKNHIIRKSVNLSKQTHIIASNIDVAFLLITFNNPATSTTFIDRFLVTAEAYHIPVILLFNKVDTLTENEFGEMKYLAEVYRSIGYHCIGISALTGKNLDQVEALMKDKTCLVSGHSGTGKSTLINSLQPGLNLKTKEISEQHLQGQHTTTFAEMYDLNFGSRIIDTPGIRGFGVVDIDKYELSNYFPEFFKLKQDCKFNNCLHVDEPKCAVKKALDEDKIEFTRYQSYLQILESKDDNYRQDQFQHLK
ncbi:ribosome small subunit-dependent GTPase A [Psychroflexus sp. ALD_RP9]|uniref:ribosome small subunit-dependent GTPase A n=1 Tax=Psychroflexus sp. ALD_RP9 TaxID=2777186 RepID=UPI001A8E9E5B|nr:ribosome small subunit-dependent GTPase A [Psychroflexus sp. ALD_RP9]QSS97131.1 ribosome small subunit-dependent GTPase A [Psychroflexus sp. ALD_RP9]